MCQRQKYCSHTSNLILTATLWKHTNVIPIKQMWKLRLGNSSAWCSGREETVNPGSLTLSPPLLPVLKHVIDYSHNHTPKSFFAGLVSYFLIFLPTGKYWQTQRIRGSWYRGHQTGGTTQRRLAQHRWRDLGHSRDTRADLSACLYFRTRVHSFISFKDKT